MLGLFLAAVFIALNGFFVAAEFAMVKMSATLPSQPKGRHEDSKLRRTREVVGSLGRYLSVTQLGITLASLGLGWIGEPALEGYIDRAAVFVMGQEPGRAVHVAAAALALAALTFAHVLFGELVPKLVAIQRSEKMALASAGPLHFVFVVFRPLLWVLEQGTRIVLRMMGMRATSTSEGQLSEEELVGILAANAAKSPKGKEKAHLFERVARFAERTARHAMVPRVDMFSLPQGASGADAIRQLRTHQYSRVPLAKEKSVDEIVGYLYAKDLLLDPGADRLPSLETAKREILFVPESQTLLEVLGDMKRSQIPIAIVVDEYGGTSGLLTMEDLLEEIVGEIRDELDVEHARVVKVGHEENTWDVDAGAMMEELRAIGAQIDDEIGGESVGIVVLQRLGRIPRIGDKVEIAQDVTAEITSVSRRRIMRLRVRVRPPPVSEPT